MNKNIKTGSKVIVQNTKLEELKRFIGMEGIIVSWIQKKETSNKKRKVLFNQGTAEEETAYFFDDELEIKVNNMKIIAIDNYDRETYDDVLVAENVHEYYGEIIVNLLNEKYGEDSERYFKLVKDDHKLYKFEP